MSCIHYKFKSSLDYRTVTFDGLHLSLCELKRMIFDRERIRASDFDLLVTNAQTNEVYEGETAVVVRNSSVIVSRIPVEAQRKLPKIWDRGTDGVVQKATTETLSPANAPVKRLSAYSETLSEEEKLKKMEEESTSDYDPSRYRRKNLIASGVPPPNYICNRCNQPGHWIKMCPSLNIKRTTGIPKGELMETTPDDPQAMLTSAGTYAVPVLHKQAFLMGKAEKPFSGYRANPVFPVEQKKQNLPRELVCSLCDNLLRDASLIPCCGYSYCDECIRHCLLESDDRQCPHCQENGVSPTTLIPNGKLREAVRAFQTCMKNTSHSPPMEDLPSKTTPAITSSSQSKLRVNLAQLVANPAVIVSSDQQPVPATAPVDTTVQQQAVSTSVDDLSTEAKPIVSTVCSSSGQRTVPPSNAPFSTVYTGVPPMLPTNPYMANFPQMINPMQTFPPGMPLPAGAYPRGPYPASNMSQLVGGMYPGGACQIPEAYIRFYMKEAMRDSGGRPTKRDEWEEFLARKDRRRKHYRSKSPISRTSKRERSRSSFKRSPYRKRHDSGEKPREIVRSSAEAPRHRRERVKPSLKSEGSPRRDVSQVDQFPPVKECLTRDDSGLVSLDSLTNETDINEILWESVSCDYDSSAVKSSPKRRDGSSKESIGNADTARPRRIVVSPERSSGRTTVDGINMFDAPSDDHFGHVDAYEPDEDHCLEKSGQRLDDQLWDDSRSSPVIDLFDSFGDELIDDDGGREMNVYERREAYRRSPLPPIQSTQRRRRPSFNMYRDGHSSDYERANMMPPPTSYHDYRNRSHRRAVHVRLERRRNSWIRDMVREENLNYQSRSGMFNEEKILDTYDRMPFDALEEEEQTSNTFEADRLLRQDACTFEPPCPPALPSSHRKHKERRKEKKIRHGKKPKKEKKHKKKKSKDKQTSSNSSSNKRKKRRHRRSQEPVELLTIAEMPQILDSTEWVVQESCAPEPSTISDECPLAPASSASLSVAADEAKPSRVVTKKDADKPSLSGNVGVPSEKTAVSQAAAPTTTSDKPKSKHHKRSAEHGHRRPQVDGHKQSSSGKSSASFIDRREVKETCRERKAHSSKEEAKSNQRPSSRRGSSQSYLHNPTASNSVSNSHPAKDATEKLSTEDKRSQADSKADKQQRTTKRRIVYNEESPKKVGSNSAVRSAGKVNNLEAVFEVDFGNGDNNNNSNESAQQELPIARGGNQYNPIMEPAKAHTSTVVPKPIKLKRDWVAITAAASKIASASDTRSSK